MVLSRRAGWLAATSAALVLLAGCANQPSDPVTTGAQPPVVTSSSSPGIPTTPDATTGDQTSADDVVQTTSCSYQGFGRPAKPVDPPDTDDVPASGTTKVTINMTEGPVTVTLDRAKAPCTVNSFLGLAKQGYYDNTKCHRLVDQGIYVLQCGDPTGTGGGGPGYQFADELTGTEQYTAGVVAMANAGPNTNGSQFFFVWADTQLLPDYTIFGSIDQASLEVITSIAAKGISRDDAPNPISPAKIEGIVLG